MKVTSCAGCITILLLLLLSPIAAAEDTATVHGVAYDWSTLAPLDNVVIEVNSTPVQSMVAKYGMYSFELPQGSYCVTASYYVNGDLICYDKENITIADEGNYVVDLLLVPSYSDETNGAEETVSSTPSLSSSSLLIVSVIIILILLLSIIFKIRSPEEKDIVKKKPDDVFNIHVNKTGKAHSAPVTSKDKVPYNKMPSQQALVNLSSEHLEILDIIRSAGGTMPQKELRKHLSYSEGKASVMILELERKGLIKKVKKGRGNLLFLTGMKV